MDPEGQAGVCGLMHIHNKSPLSVEGACRDFCVGEVCRMA